ncbi:hypothetical protein [Pseudonocardia xishanensis]|uniref:Parallel beta helix pectate lyase-like protein n=1 Tax=Pseudonocardia xishanensis TaxID=630995 RepID=A0ABP8RWH4_9PSEU
MILVRAALGALVAATVTAGVAVGVGRDVAPAPESPLPGCAAAGAYVPPPPGSVGVPAGLTLCPVRVALEVHTPGAVLDGLDLVGGVVVAAPDVVLRRSRITGDGTTPAGVRTVGAGSVRIEDSTLTGDFTDAAVDGPAWVAERIEITGVAADGARLGPGATLRNSWLHDFRPRADREIDAVTLAAGDGGDALVEDNRVRLGRGPGLGSAVLVDPAVAAHHESDDGRQRSRRGPVVVRGNELGGGEYTLLQDAAEGSPVRITGNRFHRDAAAATVRIRGAAVLADNLFVDGGEVRR